MPQYKKPYESIFIDSFISYDQLHLLIESLHTEIDDLVVKIENKILSVVNDLSIETMLQMERRKDYYGSYFLVYETKLKDIVPELSSYDIILSVRKYQNKVKFSGIFNPKDRTLVLSFNSNVFYNDYSTLRHEIAHMLDEINYNNRLTNYLKSKNKKIKTYDDYSIDKQKEIQQLLIAFEPPEIQAYIHVAMNYIDKKWESDYSDINQVLNNSGLVNAITNISLLISQYPELANRLDVKKKVQIGIRNFFKRLSREILQSEMNDKKKKQLLQSIKYYDTLIPVNLKNN